MANLKEIVSSFAKAFTTDKRNDGSEFTKLADDSPDWMSAIVRAAHGNMLPDDWRYKMIYECTRAMIDYLEDDAEDLDNIDTGEIADSLVDIYNWDRLQWLSSSLYRAAYCDEAMEEGIISDDAEMFQRIGSGQYKEYSEILFLLANALQEHYEASNE